LYAIKLNSLTLTFEPARIAVLYRVRAGEMAKAGPDARELAGMALLALGSPELAGTASRFSSLGYDLGKLGEEVFASLLGAGHDARQAAPIVWKVLAAETSAQLAAAREAAAALREERPTAEERPVAEERPSYGTKNLGPRGNPRREAEEKAAREAAEKAQPTTETPDQKG
jgi:hypothetical protein